MDIEAEKNLLDYEESDAQIQKSVPKYSFGLLRFVVLMYVMFEVFDLSKVLAVGFTISQNGKEIFIGFIIFIFIVITMIYQLNQGKLELRNKAVRNKFIARIVSILTFSIAIIIYFLELIDVSVFDYKFAKTNLEILLVLAVLIRICYRDIVQIPKEVMQ